MRLATRVLHQARAMRLLHRATNSATPRNFSTRHDGSSQQWSHLEWSNLKSADREQWTSLGWDQESWDEERSFFFDRPLKKKPATENFDWNQLNDEQQLAAKMLGYDEDGWNDKSKEEMDDDGEKEDDAEKKEREQKEQKKQDEEQGNKDAKFLGLIAGILVLLGVKKTWDDIAEYINKKKWRDAGLTNQDRIELLYWIKPICDEHTSKSWKEKGHEKKQQDEELNDSAVNVIKTLRACFLQLAGPIESDGNDGNDGNGEPRMVIARKSWLEHTGCDKNVELKNALLALFHAADIDHDANVEFNEFAMLLVLLTAGSDPHVDPAALAGLLFTMMDQNKRRNFKKFHRSFLVFQEVEDFLELVRNVGNTKCIGTSAKDVFATATRMGNSNSTFLSRELFLRTVGPTKASEVAVGMQNNNNGYRLDTLPQELHLFSDKWAKLIATGVLAEAWSTHYPPVQTKRSSHRGKSFGGGGGGGGGGGCFAPGTLVLMGDLKTTTKIEELRPGDMTAGGVVKATMQFDRGLSAPMFELRGVSVTGDHAVLVGAEERCFVRVVDAQGARRLVAEEEGVEREVEEGHRARPLVHDVITAEHRIHVVTNEGVTVFADYEEMPEGLEEYEGLLSGLNGGKMVNNF